jgi:RNA polymerase sigma factor
MDPSFDHMLRLAQQGEHSIRGELIQHYRPFIIRVTSHICKRQIFWNDDEASIGLIAFNEAIDRYNGSYGKSFESFAQTVIHNRLIDQFRKNSKTVKTESLWVSDHDEMELSHAEIASSIAAFEDQESANELVEELQNFRETLKGYGIRFDELEESSPDHRDTRIQLIRIAKDFSKYPFLLDQLEKTKKLPLRDMLDYVAVSKKTLERNRKYLISLILIYSSDEFRRIRSTISFAELGE